MRSAVSAILLAAVFATGPLSAQQTTVTFSASPNPAVFGQSVTLTALVTPSAATGRVTFYDGADILGISPVTSGMATFSTALIQAGNRSLRAYYSGDATHAAASSSIVQQHVNTGVSYTLTRTDIPVATIAPNTVAVADFNGDGKPDVVVGGYYGISVLLGNGNGTFRTSAQYLTNSNGNYWIIISGDFNQDGKTDIAYFNNYSPVVILLGKGDGTFQAPLQYSVGQPGDYLSYAGVADFNGDGKPDLAVTGNDNNGIANLYILLGNGDGTFQTPVAYPIDNYPAAFATGDFNGDGRTDIAVACYYGQVDILKGNGDGTLQPRSVFYAENTLEDIAAGDFNGDGKLDLALAFQGSIYESGGVSTLTGNGDGTFQGPVEYITSSNPTYLVVGDFNGDGKLDLAATAVSAVSILLGNGNRTFVPPINLGQGNGLFERFSIAVASFDGRGQAEIVAPNQAGGISLLLGLSSPYLGPSLTQSGTITQGQSGLTYVISAENFGFTFGGTAQLSYSLGTGLTVASIQSPGWACTPSTGGGSCTHADVLAPFQSYPPITLTLNASPSAPNIVISTATLSFPGINAQTYSVSVTSTILQSQAISFPVVPNHINGDPPFSVSASATSGLPVTIVSSGNCSILGTVVTLDGAGSCTLTATQAGSAVWGPAPAVARTFVIVGLANSVAMTASPSSSQLGKPVTLTATITPARTLDKVTFFDGTAIVGIAPVVSGTATLTTSLLSPGKHLLKAYYGGVTSSAASQTVNTTGLNGFVSPSQAPALGSYALTYELATADFNGDGRPDLVVVDYYSGNINVLLGNGDGTFQILKPVVSSLVSAYGTATVATADVNGDGKTDLLVTSCSVLGVFLGNGDGTFQPGVTYSVANSGDGCVGRVAIADFNGDGKADLAYPGYSVTPNPIEILLGNGDGSFGPPVDVPVYSVTSLLAGDFNGDGKADLAVLGATSIGIVPGNGDGTFRMPVYSTAYVGGNTASFVAGDFNNDGRLDLAFANVYTIGVLLGNGDATFKPERDYSITGYSMLTTQLNQHQNLDLVVTSGGAINALPGNGDGTFGAPVAYAAPTSGTPQIMVTADFNGDGKPDFAIAGVYSNLSILLGNAAPVLSISMTHPGNFSTAQDLGTYTISVQNTGIAATAGTVSVTSTVPSPLVVQSIGGTGWTCFNASLQCIRGDSLAAGGTYSPITIKVSVPSGPTTIISQAAISGGAAAAATATDITTITPTYLTFTAQPVNTTAGTTLPAVVVQMQDPSGRLVSGSSVISLRSNPAGVSATATAVNGVATFSGLMFSVPGTYTLIVTSPVLQTGASNFFTITASPLPSVTIESPAAGAVLLAGNITVSGWSLDNIYRTGTAIKVVGVTVDGISQGIATYGGSRPDVCAAYPGRPGCPNVGYSFTALVSPGPHTIEVDATNSNGVTGSSTVNVTVQAAMAGTKVGIFRNGAAFLEDSNGNGVYDPVQDRYISGFSGPGGFIAGDYPVMGDWTGDGHAKAGIYRSITGTWYLDANNNGINDAGDLKYQFGGLAGDIPFAGDWNGLGKSCIGLYRTIGSVWLLDMNCNGTFDNAPLDAFFPFGGVAGDVPVVGAWTGGTTRVGVVRKYAPGGVPSGNPFYWVLDGGAANAGSAAANHQPAFAFAFGGLAGDVFVTGDWNNNGTGYAAVFRNGFWVLDAGAPSAPQGSHVPGLTFGYGGVAGDVPITGRW